MHALAQSFVRDVLERFGQIVEERFGDRDVAIGRLDLRCRLSPAQLADPGQAARVASELAAGIIDREDDELLSRTTAASEAGWRDLPRSTQDRPALPPGQPFSAGVPSDDRAEMPAGILRRVAPPGGDRAGTADPAGSAMDDHRLGLSAGDHRLAFGTDPLATAGSATDDPRAGPPAGDQGLAFGTDPLAPAWSGEGVVEWLMARLRDEASGTGVSWLDARRLGEDELTAAPLATQRQIVMAALSRLDAAGDMVVTLARLAAETIAALLAVLDVEPRLLALMRSPDSRLADAAAIDAGLEAHARPLRAALAPASASVALAVRMAVDPVGGRAFDRTPGAGRGEWAPYEGATKPRDAADPPATLDVELRTRFGGLFYLLSLVLELGIGESLWKACLPEGQVLAQAAAAILGDGAHLDVAPRLFGGEAAEPGRAIAAEQQQEVCGDILAGVVAALPRLGLATLPMPVLEVIGTPFGRLLVATCGFPAAIFAWPAPDADAVAAGIEAFLAHWPRDAEAPQARDSLPDFDRSGRVRRADGPPARAQCLLPGAPTVAAGCCAGSGVRLFAAAVSHSPCRASGESVAVPAALVSRNLALFGAHRAGRGGDDDPDTDGSDRYGDCDAPRWIAIRAGCRGCGARCGSSSKRADRETCCDRATRVYRAVSRRLGRDTQGAPKEP